MDVKFHHNCLEFRPSRSLSLVRSDGSRCQIATNGEWELHPTAPQNIIDARSPLKGGARNLASYSGFGGRQTRGRVPDSIVS